MDYHYIIAIVFISLYVLFFLSYLLVELLCLSRKSKKKVEVSKNEKE